MSNNSFSRTRRQRDFVSLQLCLYLYQLCNGRQFEYMEPSDFVSFLNLRRGADGVVRDREKLRVIYLIHEVADNLSEPWRAEEWKGEMLSACGIDMAYYNSHYLDVKHSEVMANKRFANELKKAISRANAL